ncbi:hypothetical protein Tco_1259117 [Tanacetum coccineum]
MLSLLVIDTLHTNEATSDQSLDYLNSSKVNLISDLEYQFEEEETEAMEVILFYNGLEVPTRQILDSKGAIPTKIAADAKMAIQEMAKYSQKWHNGTSKTRSTDTFDGLAAI